jgi:hypothetical protein
MGHGGGSTTPMTPKGQTAETPKPFFSLFSFVRVAEPPLCTTRAHPRPNGGGFDHPHFLGHFLIFFYFFIFLFFLKK